MDPVVCALILASAAATAIGTIGYMIGGNLGRIADALYGRPQVIRPETSREHWRRVHLAADNARARELSRQGDAA